MATAEAAPPRRESVRFTAPDGDVHVKSSTENMVPDPVPGLLEAKGPSSSSFRRMSRTFSTHKGLTRKAGVSRVKVIDSHPHYEINISVGSNRSRLTYRFVNFHDMNEKVESLWHPLSSGFPRRRFRSKLAFLGVTMNEGGWVHPAL
mmetsp:Transcript_64350/g.178191  ORF Transcript_64350/g.178191 Transcript_64350/m.178191 type:complete len:147 (+) Transcript_64350:58-498(+)